MSAAVRGWALGAQCDLDHLGVNMFIGELYILI